jgi:hypothetical protein
MLWPSFGANVMRLGKDADNYLQTVARSGSVISTNAIFFHVFFLNKENVSILLYQRLKMKHFLSVYYLQKLHVAV